MRMTEAYARPGAVVIDSVGRNPDTRRKCQLQTSAVIQCIP
jgi:hypothetical protein